MVPIYLKAQADGRRAKTSILWRNRPRRWSRPRAADAQAGFRPGRLNYGSAGSGTSQHLAGALFATRAGIEITHVPYRGGAPAVTDLVAGKIQFIMSPLIEVLAPGELVAGKSTVPVGTAARLSELVAGKVPGALLAWNPEFLREGFAVQDTLHPDRLVYGLPAGEDGDTARALRRGFS